MSENFRANKSKEQSDNGKIREINIKVTLKKLSKCALHRRKPNSKPLETTRPKESINNTITSKKKLIKTKSESNIRLSRDTKQAKQRVIESEFKSKCTINNQYLINKYEKEFSLCLNNLGVAIKENTGVKYDTMKQILINMGFGHEKNINETLADKIFNRINRKGYVKIKELKKFIAAIMNIALDSNISLLEVAKIHNEYKSFYFLKKSLNAKPFAKKGS